MNDAIIFKLFRNHISQPSMLKREHISKQYYNNFTYNIFV